MKWVLLLFLFSKPIATSLFDDNLTIARILPLSITDHALPIADRDTRESPVREMVKELKEYCVEAYGYDPLLSK